MPSTILISLYYVTGHIHRFGELGCEYIWGLLFCLPKVCMEELWVLSIFAPNETPLQAVFMLDINSRVAEVADTFSELHCTVRIVLTGLPSSLMSFTCHQACAVL